MSKQMIASDLKSSKYFRNPREKGWILCRRMPDGSIECLMDESTMTVNWSKHEALLWYETKSPLFYLKLAKTWTKRYNGEDMFIVRVNTKKCPIVIDYINAPRRANKGNVYFCDKRIFTK